MIKNDERLKLIRQLVDIQAEDDGLWFIADSASEAYFQQRLRELHTVIESDNLAEITRIIEKYDD